MHVYRQPLTGVFCTLACAWILGCALAIELPWATGWLIGAAAGLLVFIGLWRSGRLRHPTTATVVGVLAIAMVSGAWTSTISTTQRLDDIGRYASATRTLVRVTGQVDTPPRATAPPRGAMAKFGYNNAATLFEMRVTSMESVAGPVKVSGRLLVREPMHNDTITQGQQLSVMGWLTAADGPKNPGEMDFRQWMVDRDLSGFLSLAEAGSATLMHEPATGSKLVALRTTAGRWATTSLEVGLQNEPRELALLYALLLGRRGQGLETAQNAFRRVGLAHILSISGAHLGILVSMLVLAFVVTDVGPWVTAWAVTLVLGFYLLVVPPQVPVIRAAIMALILVWGYAAGRRVALLDPLALACVLVLMWRPHEMYSPGFQLSFGVVAGLVCFTGPVARFLSPRPALVGMRLTSFQRITGWMMAYVAANLVAFMISLPLVMYHFSNISPLTVVLSILTLPLVTAVLGLGYVKILIGLFLPGLGQDMAGLLWWTTYWLLGLVQWASEFRVAYFELAYRPSPGWTIAALSLVTALFSGWFYKRKSMWLLCMVFVGGWLLILQMGYRTQMDYWPATPGRDVAVRVNFFAVGDGNCYLLRFLPQSPEQGEPYTMLYDCGSRWVDGGLDTIIPALQALGVRRIDTLVISHADMDHFNAVIDLSQRVKINEVMMSPQMIHAAANAHAGSAPGHLYSFLENREIPVKPISRGWQQTRGGASLEVLWPPAEFVVDDALNDNDLSVVMSIQAGGKRLLLSGDIQKIAMSELVSRGDALKADVTDMPHHGSYVRGNSLMWIAAVSPTMVVQSCGMNRVEKDPWLGVLPAEINRLRTAVSGMIELDIEREGQLVWRTFKQAEAKE